MDDINNAIKSIFLSCIKDPDILKELSKVFVKNQLNIEDKQIKGVVYEDNNIIEILSRIEQKINLLDQLRENIENNQDVISKDFRDNKCKETLEEVIHLRKENTGLKENIDTLECEKIKLQNEVYNSQEKYRDVEEIVNVWNSLNSLSEEHKDYLLKLCENFNLYSCLSLGRDNGKINQLWGYLRDKAVESDSYFTEIKKLNLYFEFCLKVINSISSEKNQFIGFELPEGSDYDVNKCIKASGSRQIGVVKKTIVKGYKKNERIVYKSIVVIE